MKITKRYISVVILTILIFFLVFRAVQHGSWPSVPILTEAKNFSIQKADDKRSRVITFSLDNTDKTFTTKLVQADFVNKLTDLGWNNDFGIRFLSNTQFEYIDTSKNVVVLNQPIYINKCPAFFLYFESDDFKNDLYINLTETIGPCGWLDEQ